MFTPLFNSFLHNSFINTIIIKYTVIATIISIFKAFVSINIVFLNKSITLLLNKPTIKVDNNTMDWAIKYVVNPNITE